MDQDFYNAPKNANSWGADIFVSIHSNAGGGHGTETLGESDLRGDRAGDERPTEGCGGCGVTPGATGLSPWLLVVLVLVWRRRR